MSTRYYARQSLTHALTTASVEDVDRGWAMAVQTANGARGAATARRPWQYRKPQQNSRHRARIEHVRRRRPRSTRVAVPPQPGNSVFGCARCDCPLARSSYFADAVAAVARFVGPLPVAESQSEQSGVLVRTRSAADCRQQQQQQRHRVSPPPPVKTVRSWASCGHCTRLGTRRCSRSYDCTLRCCLPTEALAPYTRRHYIPGVLLPPRILHFAGSERRGGSVGVSWQWHWFNGVGYFSYGVAVTARVTTTATCWAPA